MYDSRLLERGVQMPSERSRDSRQARHPGKPGPSTRGVFRTARAAIHENALLLTSERAVESRRLPRSLAKDSSSVATVAQDDILGQPQSPHSFSLISISGFNVELERSGVLPRVTAEFDGRCDGANSTSILAAPHGTLSASIRRAERVSVVALKPRSPASGCKQSQSASHPYSKLRRPSSQRQSSLTEPSADRDTASRSELRQFHYGGC